MMKATRVVMAILGVTFASASVAAQPLPARRLTDQEASVAQSALEWFIRRHADARGSSATIVLADSTGGVANAAVERPGATQRKEVRLSANAFGTLKALAQSPIRRCLQVNVVDPCGIAAPWIGVGLSNPWIDGDNAKIILYVFSQQPSDRVRSQGGAELTLARVGEVWKVVSFTTLQT